MKRDHRYGQVIIRDNALRKFALRSLHGTRGFNGWYEITDKEGNVQLCDISIPLLNYGRSLGIHVVGLAVLYEDCMMQSVPPAASTYDSGYTMPILEPFYANA